MDVRRSGDAAFNPSLGSEWLRKQIPFRAAKQNAIDRDGDNDSLGTRTRISQLALQKYKKLKTAFGGAVSLDHF